MTNTYPGGYWEDRGFNWHAGTIVAYARHPLAVVEIANNGHNGHVEALLVALMMLGVWLLLGWKSQVAFVDGMAELAAA